MLELCRSQDLTPAEGIGIKVGGKSHGGSMKWRWLAGGAPLWLGSGIEDAGVKGVERGGAGKWCNPASVLDQSVWISHVAPPMIQSLGAAKGPRT
ncbi:unnamed protein product [Arctogadus glacialis]